MTAFARIPLVPVAIAIVSCSVAPMVSAQDAGAAHEVWMLDQSNTYDSNGDGVLDSGGTLYVVEGESLAGANARRAPAEVIDLGGAVAEWIRSTTGTVGVRPHYITFNPSNTHAIISFVATGHVLIVHAGTRTPVFVVDVGAQAHAAVASPDETYILVANQNGKRLQRINTHYALNAFALDHSAELNLTMGVTPAGLPLEDPLLRPDNAPILALPSADSTLAFVTLRGGGLFVVNAKASPMAIVGEYTRAAVGEAGLLAVQTGNTLFFNSGAGGGAALPRQAVLYSLPTDVFSTTPLPVPDSPLPFTVFGHLPRGNVDSHGLLLTRHERYLWVADRAANRVIVVDTTTHSVVNEFTLEGAVSDDPAPDLFAMAPSGNRVYVTLRGPIPLTGNNPITNNAVGSTPGIGVIRVEAGGVRGTLQAVLRTSNRLQDGTERSDPHGISVRVK
jgi:DNA-binding beta-propeller fold protein YncE